MIDGGWERFKENNGKERRWKITLNPRTELRLTV